MGWSRCYWSPCVATGPLALLLVPLRCHCSPCVATAPLALLLVPLRCYCSPCVATAHLALLLVPLRCYWSDIATVASACVSHEKCTRAASLHYALHFFDNFMTF